MKQDIRLCKQLGFEGVVLGCLQPDGSINRKTTAEMVELAYPMDVTFHRAFDRCRDPFDALEVLISCGCSRVLTSGQKPDVNQATELIKQLIAQSNQRIIILPGSGIKSAFLKNLIETTGAREYHASARIEKTESGFVPDSMEETLYQTIVNEEEVMALKKIMHAFHITSKGS